MPNSILVIGATGNQGGGAIDALLKKNFSVKAFVRNPNSEKALKLKERGVELVAGDANNPEDLVRAMQGVHGVFYPSIYNLSSGEEDEVVFGKKIADAAKQANVAHFVYSSVGGAERKSGIPHFESKWKVEEYIRSLKLSYTILRPVAFMENFSMLPAFVFLTMWRSAMGDNPLQVISVRDIGKWAALAFSKPEVFMKREIEIAGDVLTYEQIQEAYKKVIGRRQFSVKIPNFLLVGGVGHLFRWFRDEGYKADMKYNREQVPDNTTFEKWLELNSTKR